MRTPPPPSRAPCAPGATRGWHAGSARRSARKARSSSQVLPAARRAQGGCITPLVLAASSGKPMIVKLLLDAGASVHESDELGNSALWLAVVNDRAQCVQVLLDHGADLHARDLVRRRGRVAATNVERTRLSNGVPPPPSRVACRRVARLWPSRRDAAMASPWRC